MADTRASRAQALARRAFRKVVYRRHLLERYEGRVDEMRKPSRPLPLEFKLDFVGPDDFDAIAGTNPYLSDEDVRYYQDHDSLCVVIRDGERTVSSAWLIGGDVFVPELQRLVTQAPNEYYSCRYFVDEERRGMSLMAHMLYAFRSLHHEPQVVVWGLIYPWNTASIVTAERTGMRCTGVYWTRWIAGVKIAGARRFPPRPTATTADRG